MSPNWSKIGTTIAPSWEPKVAITILVVIMDEIGSRSSWELARFFWKINWVTTRKQLQVTNINKTILLLNDTLNTRQPSKMKLFAKTVNGYFIFNVLLCSECNSAKKTLTNIRMKTWKLLQIKVFASYISTKWSVTK